MPTTKAPTLSEISRLAGCSKAAASAVLNGSRGNIVVSDALRQRVMAVAQELDYRPNYASRSLALRRTDTLGIYIPPRPWGGIGGQYEGAILRGIEKACMERGYNVLVINVAGAAEPSRCLDLLVEQRIDGLLILHVDGDEAWIDELLNRSAAVAATDCLRPNPRLDAVLFDNDAAIRMAVDHLRSLGHQRIGYLGPCGQRVIPHNEVRKRAFVACFDSTPGNIPGNAPGSIPGNVPEKSPFDGRLVFDASKLTPAILQAVGERGEHGEWGIEYFLGLGEDRPTALMAYNDLHAAGAIRQLAARGLSVPGDMSLVTVEDTVLSSHLAPRLTSVWHPLDEMGACAAHRLIDRAQAKPRGVKSERAKPWHQRFSPTLKIRESTSPPRS